MSFVSNGKEIETGVYMLIFLFVQSFCIYYLGVMFSPGQIILCLLWERCSVGQSPSATREERSACILNIVPGLRPGF